MFGRNPYFKYPARGWDSDGGCVCVFPTSEGRPRSLIGYGGADLPRSARGHVRYQVHMCLRGPPVPCIEEKKEIKK